MDLFQSSITKGFSKDKINLNESVTLMAVYNQFKDNRFKALECNPDNKDSHIFYDSDVAKWLEAVAYSLLKNNNEELRKIASKTIDTICEKQLKTGYFNSYFQTFAIDKIFTMRSEHELYCAGHLFEAAYAWKKYLNDERLLNFSSKYVDYIIKRFMVKKDAAYVTPGHEEIELALLRLYELTNVKKYLKLAKFFLNNRGVVKESLYDWADAQYAQYHLPIIDQHTAEGHSVRALYLYNAMAELARVTKDSKLKKACKDIYDDIVTKKMYITGAVGSTYAGERFTIDYDLPNDTAYGETCASIALALYTDRLMNIDFKSTYGDTFERVFYNGLLAGYSHNGKAFFYDNPLEVNEPKWEFAETYSGRERLPMIERSEVFGCSCCPPNVNRFIERLPEFIHYIDKKNCLYINQFMSSKLTLDDLNVEMESAFPYSGEVKIKVDSKISRDIKIRIPFWCKSFEINCEYSKNNGYIVLKNVKSSEISINFKMELRKVYPNGNILDSRGKFALMYGPLVMAIEGTDNDFAINSFTPSNIKEYQIIKGEYFKIKIRGTIEGSNKLYNFDSLKKKTVEATLIPYFEWGNRGKTSMKVYF